MRNFIPALTGFKTSSNSDAEKSMFLDFLLLLRSQKLKIGMSEWLTLMEALDKGLADNSLDGFYLIARAICCKSEAEFDVFDACFLHFFK